MMIGLSLVLRYVRGERETLRADQLFMLELRTGPI
jgi:hypothetical protein